MTRRDLLFGVGVLMLLLSIPICLYFRDPYRGRSGSLRPGVAIYPRTNQDVQVQVDNSPSFGSTITRFSTQDSPIPVKQFYEQSLTQLGWDVELVPLAAIRRLPTPRTAESLLVHGNDAHGCPLHYVDVVIEPLKLGANVTVIVGDVPCY